MQRKCSSLTQFKASCTKWKKYKFLITKISKHIWYYKKCKGNITKRICGGYDHVSSVAQVFITVTSHTSTKFKLLSHNRCVNYKVSLGVSFSLKGHMSINNLIISNSEFLLLLFCHFNSIHTGQTADRSRIWWGYQLCQDLAVEPKPKLLCYQLSILFQDSTLTLTPLDCHLWEKNTDCFLGGEKRKGKGKRGRGKEDVSRIMAAAFREKHTIKGKFVLLTNAKIGMSSGFDIKSEGNWLGKTTFTFFPVSLLEFNTDNWIILNALHV